LGALIYSEPIDESYSLMVENFISFDFK